MKVYKNTIMKKALAELDLVNMDAILEGPSAFVFCDGDVAAAAKAITEFAKENKKLEVKGGMMDGTFVTAEEIAAIVWGGQTMAADGWEYIIALRNATCYPL